MHDYAVNIAEVVEEAGFNPYPSDSVGILFNNMGMLKFKEYLSAPERNNVPLYLLPLKKDNIQSVLANLEKLLPYQKGISLKLTAPQKRRKLVAYINNLVLNFIGKTDLESFINIIYELSANSEKSNLEYVIRENKLAENAVNHSKFIIDERETILNVCHQQSRWVKISWKFSPKIIKVEIKNNTPIEERSIANIKDKVSVRLDTIAEGFHGEMDDKLGAGLGLFFINFFKDEIKMKYDFETMFRIYENDDAETVTSITVIFEKINGRGK